MASKRGIVITAVILAGITGASFLAWLPGGIGGGGASNQATFVISDHREYLDSVRNIHEVLVESTAIEFAMLLDGEITAAEYARSSEATSTQTAMQISEFITSKPPEEWQESYILYGEALRSFNTYVAETQAVASLIAEGGLDGISDAHLRESLQRMEHLLSESDEYVKRSDVARPLT